MNNDRLTTPQEHLNFVELFEKANSQFNRTYEMNDGEFSYIDSLQISAIAKCLDFNIYVQSNKPLGFYFFMVGNLRSIIEELIFLAYFKNIESKESENLARNLHDYSHFTKQKKQLEFFVINNNRQPTFGGLNKREIKNKIIELKNDRVEIWRRLNFNNPPSVNKLANKVNIATTYDYFYHLTSNFVHFNPTELFRLGWGTDKKPFSYSINHFDNYYSALSKFLGALVFLGFCNLAPNKFDNGCSSKFSDIICKNLRSNFRWPELLTYEEMNVTPPDNFMVHHILTLIRNDNHTPMRDVISELENLKKPIVI